MRTFYGSSAADDTLQYLLDKIRNKIELSFSEKLIELIEKKERSLLKSTKKQM